MSADTEIQDGRTVASTMTVEEAVALSSCAWDGACSPRCRHCSASEAEVAAAKAWLGCHPGAVAAWRARRLGQIGTSLRTWEPYQLGTSGRWGVRTAEDGVVVGRDLSREQAHAIADVHNGEREHALTILDWFMGA